MDELKLLSKLVFVRYKNNVHVIINCVKDEGFISLNCLIGVFFMVHLRIFHNGGRKPGSDGVLNNCDN